MPTLAPWRKTVVENSVKLARPGGSRQVVSDAGGLPETVSPGKSGIVFENRNLGQLGEAVLSILRNRDRRIDMGRAARQWAMQTFSWDVIAAQLDSVYQEAIAR